MNSFDVAIFRWLNSLVGLRVWLDAGIILRARWLGWLLAAGLLLFLVFGKEKRRELRMVLEAFGAGVLARFVFVEFIRLFYNRPRPFEVLENVRELLAHSPGASFPSGHAAFFFALATSVWFYHRLWGAVFFLAALSLSFSRIAAGLHWPSDVLAGAFVGMLSSVFVRFLATRRSRPS